MALRAYAVKLCNLMQVAAPLTMTRSVDSDNKRVTVTLPKHQFDALQAIALREDVSVAWLVRKAVDKLLRQGHQAPMASSHRPDGKGNP